MRISNAVMALVLAAGSAVAVAEPAQANHFFSPWHQARWSWEVLGTAPNTVDQDRVPQWHFDNDYPTGSHWRNRAIEAADTWVDIPGYANFDFQEGIADSSFFDFASPDCDHYQDNIVGVSDLPSTQAAATVSCRFINYPQYMFNFRIALDTDRIPSDPNVDGSYYEGLASTWDGSRPDLRSLLTHEFGHAAGRVNVPGTEDGHFEWGEPGGACPNSNNDATMCTSTPRNNIKWRDLTTHDITSFQDVPGYD